MDNQLKWDKFFLDVARTISTNSKCLSRQIGAVLVRDKSIIATGYNGPARGIPHCEPARTSMPDLAITDKRIHIEKVCPRHTKGFKSGEGLHLCPAAHAESNTIANAALNGVSTKGCTLYMNCVFPCKDCLAKLINAGITTIVIDQEGFYDPLAEWMLEHSNISLRVIKEA